MAGAWIVDPFGGVSWEAEGWSHGLDVTSFAGFDDPAAALAALVECVRKAEVYDRIAEIVRKPEPTDLTKWVPEIASRYEFVVAEFPEVIE